MIFEDNSNSETNVSRVSPYSGEKLGGIQTYDSNGHRSVVHRDTHYIAPHHIQELSESGIDRKVAQTLKIRTVRGAELAEYGWENGILQNTEDEFLLFPYFDPWGNPTMWSKADGRSFPYARIKKPNHMKEGGKYGQPAGSGVHLYIPSLLSSKYGEMLGENSEETELKYPPQEDLRIVEGEKKSICSFIHTGILTVGLGGVNSYKAPYIMEYFLRCRSAQICFDNDIWDNSRIKKAIESLGDWVANFFKMLALKFAVIEGIKNEIDDTDNLEETLNSIEGLLDSIPRGEMANNIWSLHPNQLPERIEAITYTLLPRHKKGKKLGIDDWLIGENFKENPISKLILGAKIPLHERFGCVCDLEDLWLDTNIARNIELKIGSQHYWDFRNKRLVERKGDKKAPYHRMEPIKKAPRRDLCAHLICASAAMDSATVSRGVPHIWSTGQTWDAVSQDELSSHLARIRSSYGFHNGGSGISRLVAEEFNAWNRIDLPEYVEFIGLRDCDLNMLTGETSPMDPDHSVRVRSQFSIRQGQPVRWLKAAEELFGAEQIELLRAMLRLSFAPWGKTEDYLPVVVGEPGCGKSSLFRVVATVLPKVAGSNGALDRLQSKNANAGYFPLSWAYSHMVVDYDHKSRRALEPETLSLINAASENGGRAEFRHMGQNPVELPVTFRIWILANSLPKISSLESGGFKRRLVFLNCQKGERRGVEQDPLWVENTIREEGGRILNWIFSLGVEEARGIIKASKNGLPHEEQLNQITEEEHEDIVIWLESLEETFYRYRNNKVRSEHETEQLAELFELADFDFPAELNFGRTIPVDSSLAHTHYTHWCREHGYHRRTQKNWVQGLESLGAQVFRGSKGIKRIRAAEKRVRPIGLPLNLS